MVAKKWKLKSCICSNIIACLIFVSCEDKNKKIVLCKEDMREIYDKAIRVLDALQKQSENDKEKLKKETKY